MKKFTFQQFFSVMPHTKQSFAATTSSQSIEELLKITKTEQWIKQTQAQVLPVMQESINQSLESQARTLTDKKEN